MDDIILRLQIQCHVIRSTADPTLTYNTTKRIWVPATLGTFIMDRNLAHMVIELLHLQGEVIDICQIPTTPTTRRRYVGQQ